MDYPNFTVTRNPINNEPVIVLDEVLVTADRDYTVYALLAFTVIALIGISQRKR